MAQWRNEICPLSIRFPTQDVLIISSMSTSMLAIKASLVLRGADQPNLQSLEARLRSFPPIAQKSCDPFQSSLGRTRSCLMRCSRSVVTVSSCLTRCRLYSFLPICSQISRQVYSAPEVPKTYKSSGKAGRGSPCSKRACCDGVPASA